MLQDYLSGPAVVVIGGEEYPIFLTDGMFGLPMPITILGETNTPITIRLKFREGSNIPVDNTYKGRIIAITEVETIDSSGNVNIMRE